MEYIYKSNLPNPGTTHIGGWCVLSLSPCQGSAGWGAERRRGPTGGRAKGMPRYCLTLLSVPFTVTCSPRTLPLVRETTRSAVPAGNTRDDLKVPGHKNTDIWILKMGCALIKTLLGTKPKSSQGQGEQSRHSVMYFKMLLMAALLHGTEWRREWQGSLVCVCVLEGGDVVDKWQSSWFGFELVTWATRTL